MAFFVPAWLSTPLSVEGYSPTIEGFQLLQVGAVGLLVAIAPIAAAVGLVLTARGSDEDERRYHRWLSLAGFAVTAIFIAIILAGGYQSPIFGVFIHLDIGAWLSLVAFGAALYLGRMLPSESDEIEPSGPRIGMVAGTKRCPSCMRAVPVQARTCAECGHMFSEWHITAPAASSEQPITSSAYDRLSWGNSGAATPVQALTTDSPGGVPPPEATASTATEATAPAPDDPWVAAWKERARARMEGRAEGGERP